jgi:signal transduction histidine kinase
MLPDADPDTQKALVTSIDSAARRMEQLLQDLQRHARASQSDGPGQTPLRGVGTELGIEVKGNATVPLSEADLRTILSHLVQNARAHGATQVTLSGTDRWIEVSDNGSGIKEGDRDRIFNPFFTTRRAEGGTGMGLSIVQSLCQANGATIQLRDTSPGACFRIDFA